MQEHHHSGARALPASPESRDTDQRNQSLGLCSCWGGRPPTTSNVPGCEVRTTQPRGAVRMTIIRIGLDTSKHLFQIHGVDENETPVLRRQVRRLAVAEFFAKLAPARIGIEACGASHHWARVLRGLGHAVVLMPPQYLKPYVKRGKNDAIACSKGEFAFSERGKPLSPSLPIARGRGPDVGQTPMSHFATQAR